jgi:hypothetical protein
MSSPIKVNPETDQFAPVQEHTAVQNTTSDGGAKFKQFLGGAVNIAGQLASSAAGAQSFGLGPLVGNLASSLGGGGLGGNLSSGALDGGQLTGLLQLQNEIQRQSLIFNAETNISKTDFETKMSAVRNIKT